jgi:hypothetical protein
MTPYRVVWSPPALLQLAELWIEAEDQAAFNGAVRSIDSRLVHAPEAQGEHVSEGLRRLRYAPIQVLFTVDPETATVEIAHVRPYFPAQNG